MSSLLRFDYLLFVGLSVGLAYLATAGRFASRHHRGRWDYYRLQVITLIGAILGAKLSVLFGDFGWPLLASAPWREALLSGRSVTGALLFGFLFAELGKRLSAYRLPPNDRFAAMLPFSFAVGRLGCLGSGCCQGIPWNGAWSVPGSDGVPRHPTQVYELLFQLVVGLVFVRLARRGVLFGRLFALYLVIYGVFRFAIEPLRATPKLFDGYSGYQLVCVALIVVGGAFFVARTLAPPEWWQEFRPQTSGLQSEEVVS